MSDIPKFIVRPVVVDNGFENIDDDDLLDTLREFKTLGMERDRTIEFLAQMCCFASVWEIQRHMRLKKSAVVKALDLGAATEIKAGIMRLFDLYHQVFSDEESHGTGTVQ